jgi:3-oxoadipate enol-lactonase
MPYIQTDHRQLYYEVSGQGSQPLMLFNGLTMSTVAWTLMAPALEQRFRLIRLDFQGQGLSEQTEQAAYALTRQADDAAALLDHLGLPSVYLAGLSYGGMVAQHFARRHPQRVNRLLLAATLAWSDAINTQIALSWSQAEAAGGADLRFDISLPWLFSSRFLQTGQAMLPDLRRLSGTVAWAAIERIIAGVMAHDARSWLGELQVPTHIIVGDEDRLTPLYQARLLQQGINGASLSVLPGAGHALHLEAPQLFCQHIFQFADPVTP